MQHFFVFLFTALVFGQQSGQQSGGQSTQGYQALEQALKNCQDCSSAVQHLFTSDALRQLPQDKPFTLLVPNNQAIMGEMDIFTNVPAQEKVKLVRFHVLPGTVRELKEGNMTGFDSTIHTIVKQGNTFVIDGAKVIGQYRSAPSGYGYYVIDNVIAATPEQDQNGDNQQNGQQSGQQSGQQGTRQTQANIGQQGPSQGQQGQVGGQGQVGQQQPQSGLIWQLVQNDPQLSLVNRMIQQNPQAKQLLTGPLTFFLPNNNAITQVQQRFSQLQGPQIADIVRFHIVYGIIPELKDQVRLASLLPGADLFIRKVGDKFTVNGANVVGPFRTAGNQGYYVIDKLMFPEIPQGLGQQGLGQQGLGQQGLGQQGLGQRGQQGLQGSQTQPNVQ